MKNQNVIFIEMELLNKFFDVNKWIVGCAFLYSIMRTDVKCAFFYSIEFECTKSQELSPL